MDDIERAAFGFDLALERLGEALGHRQLDVGYCAATEATMWARAIDENARGDPKYVQLMNDHPDAGCMRGLCIARDAHLHKLVDTTEYEAGARLPAILPIRLGGLYWLPRSEFPRPPKKRTPPQEVQDAWDEHLAGVAVEETLRRVSRLIRDYVATR